MEGRQLYLFVAVDCLLEALHILLHSTIVYAQVTRTAQIPVERVVLCFRLRISIVDGLPLLTSSLFEVGLVFVGVP